MKIYTKTGDLGETGLFGGERVRKDHARIEAYGTLDELNAFVGLLRDSVSDEDIKQMLYTIQNRLFNLGAYLATPPKAGKAAQPLKLEAAAIQALESSMDKMDAELEPLRNFILPGGHTLVSYAHLARTVCRRAERLCVSLQAEMDIHPLLLQYLNRLSDYFFILSRYFAKQLGVSETIWQADI
ncbi:MAG: cob(I)yrinic acid a,c-diamide adenosyltransferase [Bacteroidota bacterium]